MRNLISEQTGGAFRANGLEFFIPLEGKIDVEKERLKLQEELKICKRILDVGSEETSE